MRAVAEGCDHQPVRRSQLGAERGAAAPAKPGRRARAEITPRKVRPAMLGHQGIFLDEDRTLRLDPGDAGAGPGHVDWAHRRGALTRFPPTHDERLALPAEAPPALRHRGPSDLPVEGGAELRQRRGGAAGDRQVTWKSADRIPGEQRIDAAMDDLALGPRRLEARDPRDIAFEDEDRVGIVEVRPGVVAEMTGMVGRETEVARA